MLSSRGTRSRRAVSSSGPRADTAPFASPPLRRHGAHSSTSTTATLATVTLSSSSPKTASGWGGLQVRSCRVRSCGQSAGHGFPSQLSWLQSHACALKDCSLGGAKSDTFVGGRGGNRCKCAGPHHLIEGGLLEEMLRQVCIGACFRGAAEFSAVISQMH